jgi:hypothetical protein
MNDMARRAGVGPFALAWRDPGMPEEAQAADLHPIVSQVAEETALKAK